MKVDIPTVFEYVCEDYHEFNDIQRILKETILLHYNFEEVGWSSGYHAIFWLGKRPSKRISNRTAELDHENQQIIRGQDET